MKFLLAALLILIAGPALAAGDASTAPPCKYTANFVQTRTVPGIPVPLESSGRLLVDCEQGLIWQTEQPVAEALVYTTGSHHFRIENSQSIEAMDDLVTSQMAGMLVPMLSGNIEVLEASFEIDRSGPDIKLTPRDKTTARFLKQIDISERTDGATVRLLDGNDAPTMIEVSDVESLEVVALQQCQTNLGNTGPACEALLFPDQIAAGLQTGR